MYPGIQYPELVLADTTLAGTAFEPEDVALLETALVRACERVAEQRVVGEGIRSMLAVAILEGARSGLRDPAQLTDFALRVLPSFRGRERGGA